MTKSIEQSISRDALVKVKEKMPALTQSIVLEESELPQKGRQSIFLIFFLLIAFIVWAAITPVQELANSSGEVVPTAMVKTIQHLEGGIIEDILVEEGDHVTEGQILMRLDGKGFHSELETLEKRELSFKIRAERLRAIGLDTQPDFEQYRKAMPDITKDQEAIYAVQVKNMKDQKTVVETQVEQKKAILILQLGEEKDYREQLTVVQQERDVSKHLYEKRLQTGTRYRETEENLNKVRKDLNTAMNRLQETRQEIAEKESELLKIGSILRNEAMKELGDVTTELAQIHEEKTRLADKVERLDIKSPITGIVKGIKNTTLTGVLQPGAEIMQIVPVDFLEVQTKIRPQDAGNINVGQKVVVKVSAYDYSRFGSIPGVLKTISATTFTDEAVGGRVPNQQQPASYFKATIALSKTYVGSDPKTNQITPGMTVTADIRTGEKSLLHYLIKPIYNAVAESFRER